MCIYCEKINTVGITDNNTCYYDRPPHMSGNFIRYNCDADEFVLMNSNEKVICCIDYCPWCGNNLFEDSTDTNKDNKENNGYLIVTTLDEKIDAWLFTAGQEPSFYATQKAAEKALDRIATLDGYDNPYYYHIAEVTPIATYRPVFHMEKVD